MAELAAALRAIVFVIKSSWSTCQSINHPTNAIPNQSPSSPTTPKVWSLRVDVHVLDHCGNLVDAACLAALAALVAYRKPQVSVGQGDDGEADQIVVHSPEVRGGVSRFRISWQPADVCFSAVGLQARVWVTGLLGTCRRFDSAPPPLMHQFVIRSASPSR
jgi:hypothetical protein